MLIALAWQAFQNEPSPITHTHTYIQTEIYPNNKQHLRSPQKKDSMGEKRFGKITINDQLTNERCKSFKCCCRCCCIFPFPFNIWMLQWPGVKWWSDSAIAVVLMTAVVCGFGGSSSFSVAAAAATLCGISSKFPNWVQHNVRFVFVSMDFYILMVFLVVVVVVAVAVAVVVASLMLLLGSGAGGG